MAIEEISNSDLSYLAGIFDGEGSISSYIRQTRKVSPSVGFTCGVSMRKNYGGEIIKIFYSIWGGSYREVKHEGNRKDMSIWHITDKKAFNFLQDIAPFLKVKRPQAELVIEFYRTRIKQKSRGFGKGTYPLTQEAIKQRFEFRKQLSKLNGN